MRPQMLVPVVTGCCRVGVASGVKCADFDLWIRQAASLFDLHSAFARALRTVGYL